MSRPRPKLRFFICSRDRPQVLGLCVESLSRSLREAAPEFSAHCYILDDSTTPALSAEAHRRAAAGASRELHLEIIDRVRQRAVYRELTALNLESYGLLRSTCRMLGQGSWDLAGVRNFAFLIAYCYSTDDDLIVFLDDDILLTSSVYGGHFIEIDGASVIRQLLSSTPPGRLVASGTEYFGRFDGSILDHLRLLFDDLSNGCLLGLWEAESRVQTTARLQQVSLFPSTLPTRLALPGVSILKHGPGISGALLATTPAALFSHPLPRCYNEDWIWLSLLGRPGAAIRRVDPKALHAAPPQPPIESRFVAYQNTGEVVYRAVRGVMNDAPSRCNALEWCENAISVDHFLWAADALVREIQSLLQTGAKIDSSLNGTGPLSGEPHLCASVRRAIRRIQRCGQEALESVEAMDHAALHRWFRKYLRRVPVWRRLLQESREVLLTNARGY